MLQEAIRGAARDDLGAPGEGTEISRGAEGEGEQIEDESRTLARVR